MRAAASIALLTVVTAGCDARVEEPGPPPRPPTLPAPMASGPAAATTGAPTADPRLVGRCVRQTPATPIRPLPPGPDPRCPPDPEPERVGALRKATVRFPVAGATLSVEVAERDEDRARGLMYRTSIPGGTGMLFVFDEWVDHHFWMRNTCSPLDMLFIDRDGLVVGIEEHVPTMNDLSRSVGCRSRYVLEVPAGWTRANGVRAGQFAELEGL